MVRKTYAIAVSAQREKVGRRGEKKRGEAEPSGREKKEKCTDKDQELKKKKNKERMTSKTYHCNRTTRRRRSRRQLLRIRIRLGIAC